MDENPRQCKTKNKNPQTCRKQFVCKRSLLEKGNALDGGRQEKGSVHSIILMSSFLEVNSLHAPVKRTSRSLQSARGILSLFLRLLLQSQVKHLLVLEHA